MKKSIGFADEVFVPITECKNSIAKIGNRSQYSFIKNIQICVNEDRLISVKFYNIFPAKCTKCSNKECKAYTLQRRNGGVEDFKVSFTYQQLHKFALFVASSYLRSITGENEKA